MLKRINLQHSGSEWTSPGGSLLFDFQGLIRRHSRTIIYTTLCCVGLALVYILTTPPSYTANATLIIDARKVLPLFGQQALMDEVAPDSAAIESQVEILKSDTIALTVIKHLKLVDNPEFNGSSRPFPQNLFVYVTDWLGASPTKSETEIQQGALKRFSDRLDVTRVGLTYVIEVSFRALSPNLAAAIANDITNTYVAEQLETKADSASRAAQWLQDRIRGLDQQATNAERAVVEFKMRRSQLDNKSQIALTGLESTAQTYRSLVDKFVQRYMESSQQELFPISEARVATPAVPPVKKSHPKRLLILIGSTLAGLIFGLGLSQIRELMDRRFRTASQVEFVLETDCIAIVPAVSGSAVSSKQLKKRQAQSGARTIQFSNTLATQIISSPFSRFSEAIRSIKMARDLSGGAERNAVIGVTSTLPSEGKSTVALSLAQLMAQAGVRVLLIDCDLRNPSLTRLLTPSATCGLFDVIVGDAPIEEVLWTDPDTGLAFLPQPVKTKFANSSEVLASRALKKAVDALRDRYEQIIVDLSPLAPLVDVRASAHTVDLYLLVIEWGKTKFDLVLAELKNADVIRRKMLGVVLNKANMATLGDYDGHGFKYYNDNDYRRYGMTG